MGSGEADGGGSLQTEVEAWCRGRCSMFAVNGGGGGGAAAGAASPGTVEHPLAWHTLFLEYTALVEQRVEQGALRTFSCCSAVPALSLVT